MAKKTSSEKEHMITASSIDAAIAFGQTKKDIAFSPSRALQLGYVNLSEESERTEKDQEYEIIVASSGLVGAVNYPNTSFRRVHLDVYEFFIDDMPDFLSRNNEGMLKIQVSTKNPQDLDGSTYEASFVTEFNGKDGHYAPSFLYRGVFRNILLQDWLNVNFELYELDTDSSEYYSKIKGVIDNVPEVKNLDILKGIPYLNLATQLFDGIITTFGKNPDDHLWGELPILQINPTPGGAFLRRGIYILGEKFNSNKEEIKFGEL